MTITSRLVLFFSSFLFVFVVYADDDKWKITPTEDKSAPFGVLIPGDINEAHKELDKMLTPQLKEDIKKGSENDLAQYHFGLGRWMRNNWALWKGAKLSKWFNSKGVYHPDDMSGIIIDSYYRYLRNEPQELEKQFSYYDRYWKIRDKPKDVPCDNGKLIFYLTEENIEPERVHHIAYCPNSKNYLVFELDRGWSKPNKKILARIMELKDVKGLIHAPLVKENENSL